MSEENVLFQISITNFAHLILNNFHVFLKPRDLDLIAIAFIHPVCETSNFSIPFLYEIL